ncbi:MAG: transposase, partial [Lachnospiraceae bacterium]|nr:transposase [Lachnospiraceae bacterium]
VYKVDTKKFRASQYNHVTDDYVKSELSERDKLIDGHKVQRDLYSAFLLKNGNNGLNKPDRDKCIFGFNRFLELQDNLITEMKTNNVSMKQCFGF